MNGAIFLGNIYHDLIDRNVKKLIKDKCPFVLLYINDFEKFFRKFGSVLWAKCPFRPFREAAKKSSSSSGPTTKAF